MITTKPRIYRTWNARLGRFVWSTSHIPMALNYGPLLRAWNRADMWCLQQNFKESL